MKKVLITGKGSYIGTQVEAWLKRKQASVEVLDLVGENWRGFSFQGFDSVFHVAGIAHVDICGVSNGMEQQYYKVNCGLALEVAERAKSAGVKQFIYMSSLLVYGDSGDGSYRNTKDIDKHAQPKPTNFYGDSKWQAELKLRDLNTDVFHVAILRPPMVYGKGCKGNYKGMASIAMKLPCFPDFKNRRSVLYIGNLCEFVYLLVEDGGGGTFWPQNKELASTPGFIREIAKVHAKKIWVTGNLNWLVPFGAKIPGKFGRLVNKAFGTLAVDPGLSDVFGGKYQLFSFEESIKETEK